MNFKKNIGLVDQLFRALLILDLVIPCLLGFMNNAVAFLMISFALILLFSCATRYCWLYDTLEVTTL